MTKHQPHLARLSWTDRAIGYLPWIVGALFGAVAFHLLTILALPALWPGASYRALALRLPLGEKELLERPATSHSDLAFADPFAALAVCRFDLTQGPLRIRAAADRDHPVSVSVRLADGTIIYSANDRQTPHGAFNVLIVTQAQADAQDSAQENADPSSSGEAGNDELRLVSPGSRGFALFRALSLRESDYDAAAATRASVQCNVEKPNP